MYIKVLASLRIILIPSSFQPFKEVPDMSPCWGKKKFQKIFGNRVLNIYPTKPGDQSSLILKDWEICIYKAPWTTQKEVKYNISTHKSIHVLKFIFVNIKIYWAFPLCEKWVFIYLIFKNNYKIDTIFFTLTLSIFDPPLPISPTPSISNNRYYYYHNFTDEKTVS